MVLFWRGGEDAEDDKRWADIIGKDLMAKAVQHNKDLSEEMRKSR